MKPSTRIAAVTAFATLLTASTSAAQNSPRHGPDQPSLPLIKEVSVELLHEIPHLELAQAHNELQQIEEMRQAAVNVPRKAVAAASRYATAAHTGGLNRPDQSLLIRTREVDPETQTQLEEDLNVMSRIIEKAAQPDPARSPRAMGIDLVFGLGPGPVRTLYLDGYGALFMVNVSFPLLPAPAPDSDDSEEQKSETTWEQTRQEIYGTPRRTDTVLAFVGSPELTEGQPYDAEKVERLRRNVIEAIKNATNIRHLADDESVIVCVVGAPIAGTLQARQKDNAADATRESSKSVDEQLIEQIVVKHRSIGGDAPASTRAVMTVQATKADIDRFAGGDITLDQFRERVRTQTYPGGGASGWNPNTFLWSNH